MRSIAAVLAGVALALSAQASLAGDGGSGTFAGLKGHSTTGGVEVVQTDDGWEVRLGADFRFDGAPDPRIGFGSGGSFVDPTDFEPLRANSGAQVYTVPASIDPARFDEVYIWCRQYSVSLGVARIE